MSTTNEAWEPLRHADPVGSRIPGGIVEGEEFVRGWKNHTYTVWEYQLAGWTHLSIKRNDRAPVHDWRHLQQIKNEVCGNNREAVELYPATDRVLDASNQYHLWVLPVGKRMMIGSQGRVIATAEDATRHGAEQRPMQDGLSI